MPFRNPMSEGDYAAAAMTLMRLAGLGVAFHERWMELQITTGIHLVREWAQLMSSAQRAAEDILAGALHAGGAEPLTGRRRVPSRRTRSVVINFPERRAPGETA